ncbi:tetratricopeptide repeat protein, partial [Bacteroidota bacterium]
SKYVFDQKLQEDALFNFAKLAYELSYDPYHEAIKAFEEYIAKNPNSERVDEAHQFLLKVYLRTRNYDAALTSIDKIANKSTELKSIYQRVAYTRGTELFNDLRFKSAVQYFKKAENYPLDKYIVAKALYWQAEAFSRMRKGDKAKAYYTQFMETPGAIRLPEYKLAYYGLAYVYFENEQHTEAIQWFRKFADTEKEDLVRVGDALLRIADSYYLKKDNKLAVSYYDKAIKLDKFDTDYAVFQLAVCYGLDGQTASKVEVLKSMLENFPETDFAADAKFEIAETYFFTDKSQQAIKYFDKVIADHPNSSYVRKAKLNKGLLFYNQRNDVKALPLFEDVAENYPATIEAKEALLKIQKIYVEKGDVAGFEKYVADNNFPDITKGALDTSYYESAEFMYLRGELAAAMKEFKAYLNQFPNGFFSLNAHYYRADAAVQLKQYDEAIKDFDYVLTFSKNTFTEKALLSAANIYFYQERYQEALLRFAMLEELAELAEHLLEARIGLMRCAYLTNNFDQANEYSEKIQRSGQVPAEIINEAMLTSAKCAFAQNDLKMAAARFEQTLLKANNEFGAEAMYSLARIHFLKGDYQRSQDLIFEMINIFPNYDKWIAKSFLLLADNYIKQEDLFQARLTLQNLVDNYDGELKDEAIKKLREVEAVQPALQDRQDGEDLEIEFEQAGKVNQEIFETDGQQEYEWKEPELQE